MITPLSNKSIPSLFQQQMSLKGGRISNVK
jgi:hypothetical protein